MTAGELAGVKALVVDDEEDVRDVFAELLQLCGMNVRTASSGEEAFRSFQAERPDLVVSDIGMSEGSGIDLVRRIRALPPDQGGLTPAIAISGEADPAESIEAGYHFHFAKPVDPLLLLDTVRDFVRGDHLRGRARWGVSALSDEDVVMSFEGHASATDVRAAVSSLTQLLLENNQRRVRVLVDFRKLTGFDPSVGAVAQGIAWRVRERIGSAVIIGGSHLARLISLGTCLVLGIKCAFADAPPPAPSEKAVHG